MIPYTKDFVNIQYPDNNYEIGDHSYGLPRILTWGEGRKLRIGKFCSIAPETTIFLGGGHRTDWVTTYPFSAFDPAAFGIPGHPHSRGDVDIGNDVWLGQGCTIMSGVRIGHGACIAAYALVTKDVQPYTIVGGNPARPIRLRFTEQQIEKLLKICWWDWPIERIRESFSLMLSSDIDAFLVAAEKAWADDTNL
jgi:acetyltransferase-like isoleucine patch superfamily enzyme